MKNACIFITAMALSWLGSCPLRAQEAALASYESGRQAYLGGRWKDAELAFRRSYGLQEDPLTAYFLSLTYVELKDRDGAQRFARVAFDGRPPIKEEFRKGAAYIENLAKDESRPFKITTGTKYDTYTPPVPREARLGIGRANDEWPSPGATYMLTAKHSGMCLDVSSESLENGAPLVQYPCHDGANQKFLLKPLGEGQYSLVARHSGKCVDIWGESKDDGAAVTQFDCHGRSNQRFTLGKIAGVDGFMIEAVHSEKCLDVWGASMDEGAPVKQYRRTGGTNQLWTFIRTQ